MTDGPAPVAIVTVHGTNDSAKSLDGDKWWQRGSPFAQRLQQRLSALGIQSTIVPFVWSGANNALERERSAIRLARFTRGLARTRGPIHLVGHSHGGNVANDAAIDLKWGMRREHELISSITSVGTPYLKSPVTGLQIFGAYVFSVISVLGALTLALICTASLAHDIFYVGWRRESWLVLGALLVGGLVFFFMLREAFQGVQRVDRARRAAGTRVSILGIWHPEDEAISALTGVGTLEIEPFPEGALLEGSKTGAILWAVRLVLGFVIVSVFFLAASFLGASMVVASALSRVGLGGFGAWLTSPDGLGLARENPLSYVQVLGIVLAAGAALWVIIYFAFRLLFGALPEMLARKQFNHLLREVFRGMAFGSVGDQRPQGVQTGSYAFKTRAWPMSDDLTLRIAAGAAKGADLLLKKYRGAIFRIDADYKDLFERIPEDTMTWDGLIHTTYFEYPEIAAAVAEEIARAACAMVASIEAGEVGAGEAPEAAVV